MENQYREKQFVSSESLEAINPESDDLENTEMTAKLGVQAAFNLTWEKLDSKTQEVGELLSLFNPNAIACNYVESVSESLSWKKKDVRNAKKQLHGRNVIKMLGEEEASYQIHPLIRQFLQVKLKASAQINDLKQAFTSIFIEISKTIPYLATLEFRDSVKNAIPHLTEVPENHLDVVSDENLIWAFTGLARFYEQQSYTLTQPWFEQCLSTVRTRSACYAGLSRLGENHPDTGTSLNNLAYLYNSQGRYEEAEALYIQAVDIAERVLGANHPDTVIIRKNFQRFRGKQGESVSFCDCHCVQLCCG
ncbi:MAG: tetratricopeptide repeat protein [Cyanobacteria bacterium J06635_10]